MNLLAKWASKKRRAKDRTATGARDQDSRYFDWRFILPELSHGEAVRWHDWIASSRDVQMDSGTQIYLEIDRPAVTCPTYLLKRRLARAGISDVVFYWPKSGFAGVEMLMPLGDRRLQRFYLRSLFFGTSLSKKALRLALRLLSEVGLFELALPQYVAIARPGDAATSGVGGAVPYLLRVLLSNWTALETGQTQPRKLQWVMLNGGISEHSKIVCPLWLDDDPEPAFVMKFQRYSQYNTRLDTEYLALAELQCYLPVGPVRVPRPCGSLLLAGIRVTVETALRGKSLIAYLQEHPRRHARTLHEWEALARWLTRLHLNSARPATSAEMDSLLLRPLRTASHDLSFSPQESSAMSDLYNAALQLSEGFPLPVVYNHNDLGPPNVLSTNCGKFGGVIDWESGGFGLPATDLIYFLGRFASVARAGGKGDELRGFRAMFFGEGSANSSRIAKEWLGDYCRRLGISAQWLPVLFALCWTMHARNERQQLAEKRLHIEEQLGHTSEPLQQIPGHFRMCLRFYLENAEMLAITSSQPGDRTP